MADLIKRNVELDPFRAMREMLRWDPFREMAPMSAYSPSFDVTETKDSYVFKADVPGVKLEDLEITLAGNRLQVTGKRDFETEEKKDTYYTYERQFGTFTRAFTLPENIDSEHIKSELKDGVLTLVIPKYVAAPAKKIPISTAGSKS